jgi:hypothetical protein
MEVEDDSPPSYESLIPQKIADEISAKPKKAVMYMCTILVMMIIMMTTFTVYYMRTENISSKLDLVADIHIVNLTNRIDELERRRGEDGVLISALRLRVETQGRNQQLMEENLKRIASEQALKEKRLSAMEGKLEENKERTKKMEERTKKIEERTKMNSIILEGHDDDILALDLHQQDQILPSRKVELLELEREPRTNGVKTQPCTYILILLYTSVHVLSVH